MTRATAFAFPGQGSQRVGMLDLIPLAPHLSEALAEAERLSGLPLSEIARTGPAAALADTRAAQPLLCVADLAWAHAVENAGIRPDLVAGHSLGELAALIFADVISLEAGIVLVTERGRIMAEVADSAPGAMAAVLGLERDVVASVLDGIDDAWMANDNSAGQAVISGTRAGVDAAADALSAAGARKIVPLDVAGPFHSPLMEPARASFASLLESAVFSPARIPVVQNTDPSPTIDPSVIRTRLAEQIVAPVRWRETMGVLAHEGVGVVVEVGPGAVLTGLARRAEGLAAVSAENDGLDRVLEVLEQ